MPGGEALGKVRIVRPEDLVADLQGADEMRLRQGVLAHIVIHLASEGQVGRGLPGFHPRRLLGGRDQPLDQRHRLPRNREIGRRIDPHGGRPPV